MSADEPDPPIQPELPPPVPPELREPGFISRVARHAIDLEPLRVSREFRLLFAGQAISEFGTQITFVAVPFQVYAITRSTLAVGLLSLCEVVPLLVLPVLGGAIADAVERRLMLLVAHGFMSLLSIALAVNASVRHPRVWVLYVFSAVWASAYALYSPSIRAWPARLLGAGMIPSAMALDAVYYNTASIAGPAAGGLLIASLGLRDAYLVDAVTYVAVIAAIALMKPSPPPDEGAGISAESIRDGLRFLKGRRALQSTFWVDLNAMVFGLPESLFPAVALTRMRGGPRLLGLLYATPAVGSLAASLGSGRARHVKRQGRATLIAVALWGGAIIGFGLSATVWLALACLALAGASDFVSGIYRTAMLAALAPDEFRGRLEGISLAVVATGPSLGNLEAGAVATLTSVPFSIVSGGLLCVAGATVLAFLVPDYRRYEAPVESG